MAKNAPANAPLHPWAWLTTPRQCLHVDFVGAAIEKVLLIAMDTHSKWPEVVVMNSTTAGQTIVVPWNLFAHYGLPERLVQLTTVYLR